MPGKAPPAMLVLPLRARAIAAGLATGLSGFPGLVGPGLTWVDKAGLLPALCCRARSSAAARGLRGGAETGAGPARL